MSKPVIMPDWTPVQFEQRNWPIGQTLYFVVHYAPPEGTTFTPEQLSNLLASECDIKLYRNQPTGIVIGDIDWLFEGDEKGVNLHLEVPKKTADGLVRDPAVNFGRVMRTWRDGDRLRTRCDIEIRIYATYDSQLNEGL